LTSLGEALERREGRLSRPTPGEPHSREAKAFAEKMARSIIEVEKSINSVADIAILLEVSGITKEDLERYGFVDVYDLALYVSRFIDFYEAREEDEAETNAPFLNEIPSRRRRVMESLAMTFPWSGALALLSVTGVSLWMVSGLPPGYTTALMIGVFLGIVVSEGPMATFHRLFLLNLSQLNTCEAKRTVRRNFYFTSLLLGASAFFLLLFGYLVHIPINLLLVSFVALATISLHRASYMILYAMKKIGHMVLSYSLALALLLSIYYLGSGAISDASSRYLAALGAAFLWLSVNAYYAHHRLFRRVAREEGEVPHFYRTPSTDEYTLKARVTVQMLEALPYYAFGIFFFAMMFGDRVVSWIFNPALAQVGSLPMQFNAAYHAGADPATLVFFVTSIVQYVMMAPVYMEVTNLSLTLGIKQVGGVDEFLRKRYGRLMLATIVTSCCAAFGLNLLGPSLMPVLQGSPVSSTILEVASIGNIFLSIFVANSMFGMFMNRIRAFAITAFVATVILGLGGFALAQGGFQNVVYAYLVAAAVSAVSSTAYITRAIRRASSIFFARFA